MATNVISVRGKTFTPEQLQAEIARVAGGGAVQPPASGGTQRAAGVPRQAASAQLDPTVAAMMAAMGGMGQNQNLGALLQRLNLGGRGLPTTMPGSINPLTGRPMDPFDSSRGGILTRMFGGVDEPNFFNKMSYVLHGTPFRPGMGMPTPPGTTLTPPDIPMAGESFVGPLQEGELDWRSPEFDEWFREWM